MRGVLAETVNYIGIGVSGLECNLYYSVWCNHEYGQNDPEQLNTFFLPDNNTGTAVKHLKLFGSL
jgi:hypothetical protein